MRVSGIYIAKLVRPDTGGASHIVFVVRDDASTSDLLFQTSDTTWQAYNDYGGNSLYNGSPAGRAYKVSYNRPFRTRDSRRRPGLAVPQRIPDDPLARGERLRRQLPQRHRQRPLRQPDPQPQGLPVGRPRRVLVRRAAQPMSRRRATPASTSPSSAATRCSGRRAGRTASTAPTRRTARWSATRRRTPTPRSIRRAAWTGTWRDPRFSPPADGGRPENALTGTLFMVNAGATTALRVPDADGKMRFWRNTSVATQAPGATATLGDGHARLRMGRRRRQRFSPARTDAPVDHHGRQRAGAAGPRVDLRRPAPRSTR